MSLKVRNATVFDVNTILELTNTHATAGLMLPRSKYKIVTMLSNFIVVENETGIIGCAALAPLWTDMAEIMALAIHKDFQKQGAGKLLVTTLIERAKSLHFPKVIALTYQVDFFKKLGFTITDKDNFPRKLWRECLECPKLEKCDETAMYLNL